MIETACNSDKHFWHGYLSFYEGLFANRHINAIAEIGVFRGDSIRWLLERFPNAHIYAADILPFQQSWPIDERFHFTRMDQGLREDLKLFMNAHRYDVIIEDGSHEPMHQAMALVEGLNAMSSGGLYILEDAHTSHPRYSSGKGGFSMHGMLQRWATGMRRKGSDVKTNALSFLLAMEHALRLDNAASTLKPAVLAECSLFTHDELKLLIGCICEVHVYRRSTLPERCYRCGASDYDYAQYTCKCGVPLYSEADSMSIAVVKR